jgi:hypothetical protein
MIFIRLQNLNELFGHQLIYLLRTHFRVNRIHNTSAKSASGIAFTVDIIQQILNISMQLGVGRIIAHAVTRRLLAADAQVQY